MNDTNTSGEIPGYILAQAPLLLASLGGLIVALRLRHKAPAASLWAVGACALGIVTCALVVVGHAVRSETAVYFIGPVLWAVTCVLLLVGVYAGRPNPSAPPAACPETVWQSVRTVLRARPGLLVVFRVVFTSVFLVVVITATLVTFILPEFYVSQARVLLRPNAVSAAEAAASPGPSGGFDPRLIQTECEVIRSEAILGQAIQELDLNLEWGKQYANGERLKTTETMALLRGRMEVRPIPGTSVIEIGIYSEKPEEAAKVANAIAAAYRDQANRPGSAASVSGSPHVEIVDRAVPGFRPVRPNKPLNITLGILMGLVLGLLAGAGSWWVGLKAGKAPR